MHDQCVHRAHRDRLSLGRPSSSFPSSPMTPGCVASSSLLRWIPISSPSIAREVCVVCRKSPLGRARLSAGVVPTDRCDQIASPGEVFLSLLGCLQLPFVRMGGRVVRKSYGSPRFCLFVYWCCCCWRWGRLTEAAVSRGPGLVSWMGCRHDQDPRRACQRCSRGQGPEPTRSFIVPRRKHGPLRSMSIVPYDGDRCERFVAVDIHSSGVTE